jgi:hypothetical protein
MGILIDRTADCPYVNFSEEGLLEIEGRSITEDVFSFWQPLIDWVANYIKAPAKKTTLNVYLEYSNSSTNKYLNELLRKLEVIHKKGKSVEIIWRYEEDDESIFTLGQDLEALTTIPLKMVPVEIEKNKTKRIKIKSKKSGNEALITFKYWEAIVRNGHGEEYIVLDEI